MTATDAGRISAGLLVTLDGVADGPEEWQMPYFHPEMGATIAAQLAAADVLLLGRRTYEESVGYWPHVTAADNPMAERMNTIPKLVASTTLDTVTWQNTALVDDDLAGSCNGAPGTARTWWSPAASPSCSGCCAPDCSTSSR
jgi:dihydrofolate reductase